MCLVQTAIAEGLAHAIVNRRSPDGSPLPEFLLDKRILQLDVGQLMAGVCVRVSVGVPVVFVCVCAFVSAA